MLGSSLREALASWQSILVDSMESLESLKILRFAKIFALFFIDSMKLLELIYNIASLWIASAISRLAMTPSRKILHKCRNLTKTHRINSLTIIKRRISQ